MYSNNKNLIIIGFIYLISFIYICNGLDIIIDLESSNSDPVCGGALTASGTLPPCESFSQAGDRIRSIVAADPGYNYDAEVLNIYVLNSGESIIQVNDQTQYFGKIDYFKSILISVAESSTPSEPVRFVSKIQINGNGNQDQVFITINNKSGKQHVNDLILKIQGFIFNDFDTLVVIDDYNVDLQLEEVQFSKLSKISGSQSGQDPDSNEDDFIVGSKSVSIIGCKFRDGERVNVLKSNCPGNVVIKGTTFDYGGSTFRFYNSSSLYIQDAVYTFSSQSEFQNAIFECNHVSLINIKRGDITNSNSQYRSLLNVIENDKSADTNYIIDSVTYNQENGGSQSGTFMFGLNHEGTFDFKMNNSHITHNSDPRDVSYLVYISTSQKNPNTVTMENNNSTFFYNSLVFSGGKTDIKILKNIFSAENVVNGGGSNTIDTDFVPGEYSSEASQNSIWSYSFVILSSLILLIKSL
ncbi:hypothetical protein DICPUDRAFT_81206 [Dictyostelium purpureum]|uniref:Uncharacterized protein n=1 Tax=Dictyostelium purpureum TaxID=5786 RepID=F0ZST4_DICPU|nr:uncharacterized protein DICPUDRAFT_81206 [Dictyostelium purpureum]EGC33010.1 hypothetical protein DICPUDRAFT_81206 [Dictyostelium purpureum]|eukprot:XP_003290480.1 hypothetical protein DICPUDRAFT_81206 [Dictyostelium purpureum]